LLNNRTRGNKRRKKGALGKGGEEVACGTHHMENGLKAKGGRKSLRGGWFRGEKRKRENEVSEKHTKCGTTILVTSGRKEGKRKTFSS